MNKTESIEALKRRLDALETEAAELRKALESPEPVEKKPLVQAQRMRGYSVLHSNDGYVSSNMTFFANGFATKSQAQAYAEAFNTLLDLRRQPGSEPVVDEKSQWSIAGDGEILEGWSYEIHKITELCPWFDSEESALAAKEAVGWDRIERMMNILHGRGYE